MILCFCGQKWRIYVPLMIFGVYLCIEHVLNAQEPSLLSLPFLALLSDPPPCRDSTLWTSMSPIYYMSNNQRLTISSPRTHSLIAHSFILTNSLEVYNSWSRHGNYYSILVKKGLVLVLTNGGACIQRRVSILLESGLQWVVRCLVIFR